MRERSWKNKRDLESMERKTALHYKTDMAADCYRQIIFIDSNENHDFKNELAILNNCFNGHGNKK